VNNVLKRIREELRSSADEEVKIGGEHYFKEPVTLYGVKTPAVTKIAREYFKEIKKLSKGEILALCEELWKSGYMEESFIAHNWSYALRKQYDRTTSAFSRNGEDIREQLGLVRWFLQSYCRYVC